MKKCCPHNPDVGLLLLRIALAIVFIYAGYMKLTNLEMTTGFMVSLGLPGFMAWVIGILEVASGLAMLSGMYTCIAGGIIAAIMIGAIVLVKGKMGFSGGYDYDLVLFFLALGVALVGPGKYTLCSKLHGGKCDGTACER